MLTDAMLILCGIVLRFETMVWWSFPIWECFENDSLCYDDCSIIWIDVDIDTDLWFDSLCFCFCQKWMHWVWLWLWLRLCMICEMWHVMADWEQIGWKEPLGAWVREAVPKRHFMADLSVASWSFKFAMVWEVACTNEGGSEFQLIIVVRWSIGFFLQGKSKN